MSRTWTIVIQLFALFVQIVVPTLPIPPGALQVIHACVAFGQAAQAFLAHAYNPDGTPAEVGFIPPAKAPKP